MFGRQDAGDGVMQFLHRPENTRWDHFWNQRVHFRALRVITHDDLALQILIRSNHCNAFYTAFTFTVEKSK